MTSKTLRMSVISEREQLLAVINSKYFSLLGPDGRYALVLKSYGLCAVIHEASCSTSCQQSENTSAYHVGDM